MKAKVKRCAEQLQGLEQLVAIFLEAQRNGEMSNYVEALEDLERYMEGV